MIGRVTLKRIAKAAAGRTAAVLAPLDSARQHPNACILVYHRVAPLGIVDRSRDDWNVPPATFERQIAALAASCELVPLTTLARRLAESPSAPKPLVALTFDDGFANVVTRALPVLREYAAPATLFSVTSFVGALQPMPFDRWAVANAATVDRDAWRATTWEELEAWVAAGMDVGSHSHRHLNGRDCEPSQLTDEAHRSRELLTARLGSEAGRSFAYPYGSTRLGHVSPAYRDVVRAAGFSHALTTDLGLVTQASDPYGLPRLEAHPLDSPGVLRAKARGSLRPYAVLDRLRRADRR